MDKRSIIGFIVIFAIILIFSKYVFPPPAQKSEPSDLDSSGVVQQPDTAIEPTEEETSQPTALTMIDTAKTAEMAATEEEPEKEIVIETDLLEVLLSSRGGNVSQVVLKKHLRYDGANVFFLGEYAKPGWATHGALTLAFISVSIQS